MYLNSALAKEIISEISEVINENINIIDEKGLILASTDPERINTIHEGARLIIQSNLKQLIVEKDDDYPGCKKGTNLPIRFASEVIGVVGITGEPSETIKYGQIIQKMTEMIVYEKFKSSEAFGDKQEFNLLIHDLIHGNFKTPLGDIETRLRRNGIAENGLFTVCVIKNTAVIPQMEDELLQRVRIDRLEQEIIEAVSSRKTHVSFNGELFVVIAECDSEALCKRLSKIVDNLNQQKDISLRCAVGNEYQGYTNIYKSYDEALNILNFFDGEQTGILKFSTLMLDFTLNQLPGMHKQNLIKQVFMNCSEDQQDDFCEFIISYVKANGSLNKLSDKYFAHKNTIQYKIQKIERVTGFDLRKSVDMFILYMAAVCRLGNETNSK